VGEVKQDLWVGRTAQPGIVGQLRFQLAGFPAGVAQRHEMPLRALTVGNGEQHILGRAHAERAEHQGRLKLLLGRMQDEAAVGLHRAACEDRQALTKCRNRFVRAQLLEHIGQAQATWTVDDKPHGAFRAVLDQVDQRLGKVRIGHLRHGDQKVMLEVAGRGAFHAR
jgi:hypothetical protein